MRIAIRTDSSYKIGSGHVMRTLVLSQELRKRGAEVIFICRDLPGNLTSYIEQNGYEVKCISIDTDLISPAEDALATSLLIENAGHIDWLIVDSYSLNIDWEIQIKTIVPHIMVIDDLVSQPHECDLLLDQSYFDKDITHYSTLVPDNCYLCIGPKWFLLRPEFLHISKSFRQAKIVRRVLISFGGIDPDNVTMQVLKTLADSLPSDMQIDVVVGIQNRNKSEICQYCDEFKNMTSHIDARNIAQLMCNADLAIGTAGLTAIERIYMGLPSLVIPIAVNHMAAILKMEEQGLVKAFFHVNQLAGLLGDVIKKGAWIVPAVVENGTSAVVGKLFELVTHRDAFR